MSESRERRVTPIDISLQNIKDTLQEADQDKLFHIRVRFNGLINAYRDDIEATAMLHLLMAEHTLEEKIAIEARNEFNKRSPTSVH